MIEDEKQITIIIGVSCVSCGKEKTTVSTYLYYIEHPEDSISEVSIRYNYNYNKAHLYAIKRAIQEFNRKDKRLTILYKSDYIDRIVAKYSEGVSISDTNITNNITGPESNMIREILNNFINCDSDSNPLILQPGNNSSEEIIEARNRAALNLVTFISHKTNKDVETNFF